MIRKATKKEKKEIIILLEKEFNINDLIYIKKVLNLDNLYVYVENNVWYSFGFYKLIVDNYNNLLSNIYLLYTKSEYRNLGYIRKLIKGFNKLDLENKVKSSLILPTNNQIALIFAKQGYVNITYREENTYAYSSLGKLELEESSNYKLLHKLYHQKFYSYYINRDLDYFKYLVKYSKFNIYLIKFHEKFLGYVIYDENKNLVKEIICEEKVLNVVLDNLCTKLHVSSLNYYEYGSGNNVYFLKKDYQLNNRDYYVNNLI